MPFDCLDLSSGLRGGKDFVSYTDTKKEKKRQGNKQVLKRQRGDQEKQVNAFYKKKKDMELLLDKKFRFFKRNT